MSADYRTKNYLGYAHDNYVAVFTINGDHHLIDLDTDDLRELQSIVDQWANGRRVA